MEKSDPYFFPHITCKKLILIYPVNKCKNLIHNASRINRKKIIIMTLQERNLHKHDTKGPMYKRENMINWTLSKLKTFVCQKTFLESEKEKIFANVYLVRV